MKELVLIHELNKLGLVYIGYREVGDSFQDWEFDVMPGIDLQAVFRVLRHYDFYSIRIDIPGGEKITAERVLY